MGEGRRESIRVVGMELSDIEHVIDVHVSAFSGAMNTRLGRAYLRAFFKWFVEADDAIALLAKAGNDVTGYVVGAPIGYDDRLTKALLLPAIVALSIRPHLLIRSGFVRAINSRIGSMFGTNKPGKTPDLPAGSYSLVGIGVRPMAQGHGVGATLMRAYESAVVNAGGVAVRLSVYSSNAKARGLYEASGWTHFERPGPQADFYFKALVASNDNGVRSEGQCP